MWDTFHVAPRYIYNERSFGQKFEDLKQSPPPPIGLF